MARCPPYRRKISRFTDTLGYLNLEPLRASRWTIPVDWYKVMEKGLVNYMNQYLSEEPNEVIRVSESVWAAQVAGSSTATV